MLSEEGSPEWRHWAFGNRLAGDEDVRRVGIRKDETGGSGCGGLQVNRNDGERDEISVVYSVTTISKLFVSLTGRSVKD
jgi:hypothetical protein